MDTNSSTTVPPSRFLSRRWKWTGGIAAVLAVLAGSFTYFNTNAFAEDRLCHGWFSADEARQVLGGPFGRLTAHESSPWSCTVERTGWFTGAGDDRLTVTAWLEAEDFPFHRSSWEFTGDRHLSAEGGPGAYSTRGGWTLLPSSCASAIDPRRSDGKPTPKLWVSVPGKAAPSDTAHLLDSAARAIADGSRCGTVDADAGSVDGQAGGGTRLHEPSAVARTDFSEVCGIPGFELGRPAGPRGEEIQEQTSGVLNSPEADWVCDLSFTSLKDGESGEPLTRLAVVRNPRLVAALENRGFESAECGGRTTVLAFDDLSYLLEPEEYEATGLPRTGISGPFEAAAKKALNCTT
ncbi:hypothetical protein [Streptomyces zingiberis]|uniref:DUF3558 domain-containing protein n=1 Tax=Streptomyces zingiberis TaxID=2053010 RepID=A0ABX1BXD6_9ACTN|nr:hypothetical protein [Streptomyces zingiberis]NJQ01160.1 hypothetical protein [Streptomyces zingiberis]